MVEMDGLLKKKPMMIYLFDDPSVQEHSPCEYTEQGRT